MLLEAHADEALQAGRYDFRMGSKLVRHMESAGFEITSKIEVEDEELAFDGQARAEVLAAWRNRFERMKLLRAHCGAEDEAVRDDFLRGLARVDHHVRAKVWCVIGRKRKRWMNEKREVQNGFTKVDAKSENNDENSVE